MKTTKRFLPREYLPPAFACAAVLLAVSASWAQDNGGNNNSDHGNDISALKAQMQKMQKDYDDRVQQMQKQYENRISAMEAEIKALESKADSGTILNTRILTDADGKKRVPRLGWTSPF